MCGNDAATYLGFLYIEMAQRHLFQWPKPFRDRMQRKDEAR